MSAMKEIEASVVKISEGAHSARSDPKMSSSKGENQAEAMSAEPSECSLPRSQERQESMNIITRARSAGEDVISWATGVTGYKVIQELKMEESTQHANFERARDSLKKLTGEYESAVERRSRTQMRINWMLARRLEWTAEDSEKFAELNKEDKMFQSWERQAKSSLDECVSSVETSQAAWLRAVERHRERELAYMEAGRQLGSYASLVLLSLHTLLFATNFLLLEPYKEKRRLKRIEELLAIQSAEVVQHLESKPDPQPDPYVGGHSGAAQIATMEEVVSHLQSMEQRQQDSERRIGAQLDEIVNRRETLTTSSVDLDKTLNGPTAQLVGVACVAGVISGTMCIVIAELFKKGR